MLIDMKNILLIIFLLSPAISAQENWGEAELIWADGGGTVLFTEPCFNHETDEILITFRVEPNYDYRIMNLALDLFLPDSLSVIGFNDISPFVSYDSSTLYFSSDRPGGYGGFDIWKSVYIDDEWTMPVNLGTELNSDEDETSPTLPIIQEEIFFHRGLYDIDGGFQTGHIYFSEFSGGQWTPALPIPEPVYSDYTEYKPAISPLGLNLYFISDRPNEIEIGTAAWVSYRELDVWGEPTLLEGEVNQVIYSQPDCVHGATVSAVIDISGESLVFNKLGICSGCPDVRIYVSYRSTDVNEQHSLIPGKLASISFPNPFNASTIIQYGLPAASLVTIDFFDLLGRKVETLMQGEQQAGYHQIVWDASDRSSGMYFYRIEAGTMVETKKMVLLK